jgi:5S rRNA maturation endonuclease (ribonuclease M5)
MTMMMMTTTTYVLEESQGLILWARQFDLLGLTDPDDEGTTILRNVCNYLPVQETTRLESSATSL